MLALLPLVCLALLTLGGRRPPDASQDQDRRADFLSGLVVWGLLVVLIAESTSVFRRFDRQTVAVLWIAALVLVFSRRRGFPHPGARRLDLSTSEWTLIAGASLIVGVVGLIAIEAPPNTWDALTYHMPRVMHWIQDRTVAHYPTAIVRQLYLPPWSEFAVAELQLLSGSDHFANLVQWVAFAASLVAVSRVAGQLGANVSGQILSVALAASLPMAILQGSSVQTDLVAGLWFLIFVSEVLASRTAAWSVRQFLTLSGSLGLALLTKPTAGIFAAPFLVWFAVIGLRRVGLGAVPILMACAAVVLAVNLVHAARNTALFGSPFGISRGALNEALGPRALISNLARNAALHAASPWGAANRAVEGAVIGLHQVIGLDVNDPRTTWRGSEFRIPPAPLGGAPLAGDESIYSLFHEDTAGNPVQALIALFCLLLWSAIPALRARRDLTLTAAALALSVLLFCFALKWQPWHSRLQLPLFLLGAAWCAAVLTSVLSRRVREWMGVLLLASALPWVSANASRPLIGTWSVLSTPRFTQYFSVRPALQPACEAAASAIASKACGQIGLSIGPDAPEYLFWVVLERSLPKTFRVEHVGVANVSRTLASALAPFSPCARLTDEPGPDTEAIRVEPVASR